MFPELALTAFQIIIIGFFFRLVEAYWPTSPIGKGLLFVY